MNNDTVMYIAVAAAVLAVIALIMICQVPSSLNQSAAPAPAAAPKKAAPARAAAPKAADNGAVVAAIAAAIVAMFILPFIHFLLILSIDADPVRIDRDLRPSRHRQQHRKQTNHCLHCGLLWFFFYTRILTCIEPSTMN